MDVQKMRKFLAPEIVFGNGSRALAGKYCHNLGITKVMVVSDPGVVDAGWTDDVKKYLDSAGIAHCTYTGVTPNPRSHEVMDGVQLYKREQCMGIVAVGGGSPMDCAKGIGIVSSNKKHILDFEGIDKIELPVPPLIFIPTTAGTASEVSQFSIIGNLDEAVKIAIVSKKIVPDLALVDPETTTTMDPYLTACTGMDALVHAFEAFVSIAHSPMTDLHALEAIKLLSVYLPQVAQNPDNMDVREKVMLASMNAGLAFSNAILGAVHAMAHSLGGFLDLPHGECNAILIEHVVNFNYHAATSRYNEIAQAMGIDIRGMVSQDIRDRLIAEIVNIKQQVGVVSSLGGVGVKTADVPILSSKAVKDACLLTNPRKANTDDIQSIYKDAM